MWAVCRLYAGAGPAYVHKVWGRGKKVAGRKRKQKMGSAEESSSQNPVDQWEVCEKQKLLELARSPLFSTRDPSKKKRMKRFRWVGNWRLFRADTVSGSRFSLGGRANEARSRGVWRVGPGAWLPGEGGTRTNGPGGVGGKGGELVARTPRRHGLARPL